MGRAYVGCLAAVVSLAGAAPAHAGWSPVRALALPADGVVSVAVGARGDVAVAAATLRTVRDGSVRVHVRRAGGATVTRRLWSARRLLVDGVTVAVDRRGEVTVAWITRRPSSASGVVRAAFGRPDGRWSRVQAVGLGAAAPSVTAAPDGRVLLTWANGPQEEARATGSAWRRPGRRFGPAAGTAHPAVAWTPSSAASPPVPAFDARGRAYVWSECDGRVAIASPGSTRLDRVVTVSAGRVRAFSLSLAGRAGLASWIAAPCNPDVGGEGERAGAVLARTLADTGLGAATTVSGAGSGAWRAAPAATPGGGSVSWYEAGKGVMTSTLQGGAFGAPSAHAGLVPAATDGGGDLALVGPSSLTNHSGLPFVSGAWVQDGIAVRPAGGAPDAPAPAASGSLAVAAPAGRAMAVVFTAPDRRRLRLATWRP